jgi:hypothetical protein
LPAQQQSTCQRPSDLIYRGVQIEEGAMSRGLSRVVGIVAIVLSLGSVAVGVYYFLQGRIKHGLLFAVIFVILFLFGLILSLSKGSVTAKGSGT